MEQTYITSKIVDRQVFPNSYQAKIGAWHSAWHFFPFLYTAT
jgi:hypothetical protein